MACARLLLPLLLHVAAVCDGAVNRGVQLDVTLAPRFISRGQTFRTVVGDTLVLPCEVDDLGSYVVLWRRGSAVLTAASLMVTRDSRFRLVDGYNLQIGNVAPQDAGDYVCQISDGDNRDQIHTVEILVPPTIRTTPSNGQLKVKKGDTVTMECKASGNPVPSITWSRKDNAFSTGETVVEGFSITLEKVDRHQSGVYQCTATNGVGEPLTVDMQLDVLYPPEIEVERSWVHSGQGYEAQLVCIVHGEPAPELLWYKDNVLLDATSARTMETRGNKHTLTIRNIENTDFGNYSCVAENSLGRTKKYMEISGRPNPTQFRSQQFTSSLDSYNLTWVVESYPPLEEVRLLYRKLVINNTLESSKWHDVPLRPPNTDTFTHVMSYNIRNLEPGSAFEAIVQAKNQYGWNEVSDIFQFYTRGSEPHIKDLGLLSRDYSKAALHVYSASFIVLVSTILHYFIT